MAKAMLVGKVSSRRARRRVPLVPNGRARRPPTPPEPEVPPALPRPIRAGLRSRLAHDLQLLGSETGPRENEHHAR